MGIVEKITQNKPFREFLVFAVAVFFCLFLLGLVGFLFKQGYQYNGRDQYFYIIIENNIDGFFAMADKNCVVKGSNENILICEKRTYLRYRSAFTISKERYDILKDNRFNKF